jgi:DNA polymerase-3 subunit alpha
MGKKKAEEMAKQRATFLEGSEKNGHSAEKAGKVFDLVDFFAGYGFNKSHSAAYALITYQTAYLKAHYPVEFVCATLTADKDKTEKVVRTVAEARVMGITVLPPDVNESQIDFGVVYDPADHAPKRRPDRPVSMGGTLRDAMRPKIRFGLGGVKGIGASALEALFEARIDEHKAEQPFADLFDFTGRVDLRRINKGVLEALVQSGAFDTAHERSKVSRAQAFAAIESAIERGRRIGQDRASGQTSLFGLLAAAPRKDAAPTAFPAVEAWDMRELLTRERSALGFYVSGHPLDRYRAELARFGNASTGTLAGRDDGTEIRIGGMVEGFRTRPTKTGGKIGFFQLEDAVGRVEVIVRDRELEAARAVLECAEPVYLEAKLRWERDRDADEESAGPPEPKLTLQAIKLLSTALRERTKAVRVKVSVERLDTRKLKALRDTLHAHPGPCPVGLELSSVERWSVAVAELGVSVDPSDALMISLERLFGEKVVELR